MSALCRGTSTSMRAVAPRGSRRWVLGAALVGAALVLGVVQMNLTHHHSHHHFDASKQRGSVVPDGSLSRGARGTAGENAVPVAAAVAAADTTNNHPHWLDGSDKGNPAANPGEAGDWSSSFHPIPMLIHQTWKTNDVPSHLTGLVKSWAAMNPEYTYQLWTDEDVIKHMQLNHPELAILWPKMEPLEVN